MSASNLNTIDQVLSWVRRQQSYLNKEEKKLVRLIAYLESIINPSTTKPKVGDRVLVWFDDRWEIADYRGLDRGEYAWDFGTWGCRDDEIEVWQPLPQKVVKS